MHEENQQNCLVPYMKTCIYTTLSAKDIWILLNFKHEHWNPIGRKRKPKMETTATRQRQQPNKICHLDNTWGISTKRLSDNLLLYDIFLINSYWTLLYLKLYNIVPCILQIRNDPELDITSSKMYVSNVLRSFDERKNHLSSLYDMLTKRLSSGQLFLTKWQKFVQDARQV